jgi:hypothetical protein
MHQRNVQFLLQSRVAFEISSRVPEQGSVAGVVREDLSTLIRGQVDAQVAKFAQTGRGERRPMNPRRSLRV